MLEILKFPDERLTRMSVPVTEFGPKLHKLLDAMAETMYKADGVGLAAPQVGESIRVFVIDVSTSEKKEPLMEFINPKLRDGQGKIVYEEGCLSVPGVIEGVTRKSHITVDYQDRNGEAKSITADGLLAVALQHETDHLDGVLFVERLSPLKRRIVKKKIEKSVTL